MGESLPYDKMCLSGFPKLNQVFTKVVPIVWRMRGSKTNAKIPAALDKLKQQVTNRYGRYDIIQHLSVSLHGNDSSAVFLEEPGIVAPSLRISRSNRD